jgi:hypothetical protein
VIGDRARTVIIGVVTTVWAINFLAGLVVNGYEPSESINGIFMAIVGGLFALGARKSSTKNDDPPPPRKKALPRRKPVEEPEDEEEDDR